MGSNFAYSTVNALRAVLLIEYITFDGGILPVDDRQREARAEEALMIRVSGKLFFFMRDWMAIIRATPVMVVLRSWT